MRDAIRRSGHGEKEREKIKEKEVKN